MSTDLILLLLGCYLSGLATCFFFLVYLGHRAERPSAPARPAAPTVMLVRHDVHHHGLPSADDSGDSWKRASDE